ncbi:MAG: hypothetical protein KKC20_11250, partial [Proteobacteria bacterium]|nr:hypothetical protein [Pseudomonadota bacterium]
MNTSSDHRPSIRAHTGKQTAMVEHPAERPGHGGGYRWSPGQIKIDPPPFAVGRIKEKSRKPRRTIGFLSILTLVIIGICLAGGYYEMKSSTLQAKFISRYAAGLQY